MIITNKIRENIYNQYNGHCAYCGCELKKGWHIDHLKPIKRNNINCDNPENDNIDNLMPSCAKCNINKHQMTLEQFRSSIKKFIESLNKYSVQYQMAKKYGLIEEKNIEVKFYFEKFIEEKTNEKVS